MKKIAIISLILAGVSFLLAVVAKVQLRPLPVLPNGLDSANFLQFTEICLLVAIVLILLEIAKK